MWWSAPVALLLAANPHLDEGRRLYEQLKYPDAEARLKVAAQVPNSSLDEQAEISDLLARSMIAQGRSAEAERVYAELLAAQVDVKDPANASPKIRDVFLRAKRSMYPSDFVRLDRRPAAAGRIDVELLDPWRLVASVVMRTSRNDAPWADESLKVTGRHAIAEVQPKPGESIRVVVEARRADGAVAATLGSQASPLVFEAAAPEVTGPGVVGIDAEPKGPTRWPAFLTGALAVGGIATGTVFTVLSQRDYRQVADDTGAVETRQLDDSARQKATIAWASFGGALALAALTAVLVWRW